MVSEDILRHYNTGHAHVRSGQPAPRTQGHSAASGCSRCTPRTKNGGPETTTAAEAPLKPGQGQGPEARTAATKAGTTTPAKARAWRGIVTDARVSHCTPTPRWLCVCVCVIHAPELARSSAHAHTGTLATVLVVLPSGLVHTMGHVDVTVVTAAELLERVVAAESTSRRRPPLGIGPSAKLWCCGVEVAGGQTLASCGVHAAAAVDGFLIVDIVGVPAGEAPTPSHDRWDSMGLLVEYYPRTASICSLHLLEMMPPPSPPSPPSPSTCVQGCVARSVRCHPSSHCLPSPRSLPCVRARTSRDHYPGRGAQ